MKILVTGSSGFLGSIFCLLSIKTGDEVLGTSFHLQLPLKGCENRQLDIRDPQACTDLCAAFRPDAVIHCARYVVGVGQCEKEREISFQINATGARNMARASEKAGAHFVYISTDWIFSGTKPMGEKYSEEDVPCPLNYYGVTKWAGEQEVEKTGGRWLIARPANIYGVHALFQKAASERPNNALSRSSWVHKAVSGLRQGQKITLPDAMIQSPVLADHLAEVSLRLMKEGKTGIYNVAGRESMTRYQFMRRVVDTLGLDPNFVVKGTLEELEQGWGIPKDLPGLLPANASLDVTKVEKALGTRMLSVSEGISRIKEQLLAI
jgi:dTDP-4-dehydrorhamnose reductase